MQISVALDGIRRRDLTFYAGDTSIIDVTVYANDGDAAPIAVVTDLRFTWGPRGQNSQGVGDEFVAGFEQRAPYTLTGSIAGDVTTIAFGLINRGWDPRVYARYWPDCRIFTHLSPPELTFLQLETSDLLITESADLLHIEADY